MRALILLAAAAPLFAGNLETFTDSSLNSTQRNTACLALRGDKSEEAVFAMTQALANVSLQACAAANLRLAGAEAELVKALQSGDPSVRAVAARELGVLQKPELLPALRAAARDQDLLAASNALEGLVRYEDHSSAPELRDIALQGGLLTSLAMDTLLEWNDVKALEIGRKLLVRAEPGDQLIGVRVVGLLGDKSDLAKLQELTKSDMQMGQGSRGFGLMPAISLARAATTAIENINAR